MHLIERSCCCLEQQAHMHRLGGGGKGLIVAGQEVNHTFSSSVAQFFFKKQGHVHSALDPVPSRGKSPPPSQNIMDVSYTLVVLLTVSLNVSNHLLSIK